VSIGINERVGSRPNTYGPSGTVNNRPLEKPPLISNSARELLNLRRLPAMLNVAQTATLLSRAEHDIPLLVRAGILKPLGNPPPNAVKFFATIEVLELAEDRDALNHICEIIVQHWQKKNQAKP
jgi:hypothetical protein